MALLKQRLQAEAKAARVGEQVGKAEIRSQEAIKRRVTGLVASLKSMGKRTLPVEYKDQVDAILEQYDLKARRDVTREKRLNITEIIDSMSEQGDLAFVPKDFFKDYGEKRTLDEMTLEPLSFTKIKDAPEWRKALEEPELEFIVDPNDDLLRTGGPMEVEIIEDDGEAAEPDVRYMLRLN